MRIVAQEGFGFDRLGVRVPAVVVSPYTQAGTVITDLRTNTSMTRTLRESLDLGTAFTARDAWALPIDAAFNRVEPRQDRPQIVPLPYTPGVTNAAAQPLRAGDLPTVAMAVEQGMHLGGQYLSELGRATLRRAAVLLGRDPDDHPGDLPHPTPDAGSPSTSPATATCTSPAHPEPRHPAPPRHNWHTPAAPERNVEEHQAMAVDIRAPFPVAELPMNSIGVHSGFIIPGTRCPGSHDNRRYPGPPRGNGSRPRDSCSLGRCQMSPELIPCHPELPRCRLFKVFTKRISRSRI